MESSVYGIIWTRLSICFTSLYQNTLSPSHDELINTNLHFIFCKDNTYLKLIPRLGAGMESTIRELKTVFLASIGRDY